jgi:HEAT repeat protein
MSDMHQDPSLRRHSADALGEIGDPTAISALVEVLESEDNDTDLRRAACAALGNMREKAVGILGRLYRVLLVSRNNEVRYRTALAVIKIGGDLQQALPILTQELRFANSLQRHHIANILKGLGPKAQRAVPELLDVLGQENWVRDEIIAALKTIDPGIGPDALETRDFEQH